MAISSASSTSFLRPAASMNPEVCLPSSRISTLDVARLIFSVESSGNLIDIPFYQCIIFVSDEFN